MLFSLSVWCGRKLRDRRAWPGRFAVIGMIVQISACDARQDASDCMKGEGPSEKCGVPCFECRLGEANPSMGYTSTPFEIQQVVVGTWQGTYQATGSEDPINIELTVTSPQEQSATFGEPYNAREPEPCALDGDARRFCARIRVPARFEFGMSAPFGPTTDEAVTVYGNGLGDVNAEDAESGELSPGVPYASFDGGARGTLTVGFGADGTLWAQIDTVDESLDQAPEAFVAIGQRVSN